MVGTLLSDASGDEPFAIPRSNGQELNLYYQKLHFVLCFIRPTIVLHFIEGLF